MQAIGLGKPVVTFRTADDRPSRYEAESRLFDAARQTVEAEPMAVAMATKMLLDHPAERERRGEIGRTRVGAAGALPQIIAAI